MISPSTVYFISGANRARSIGFGLAVHILATHENAFVYTGARNPDKADALEELKSKYPGRVTIVKYIAGDTAGNAAIAKEIEERHGRVDTVIAAAGLCSVYVSAAEATVAQLNEHYQVNVVGPIILFQSMCILLKKSINPRFIAFSSGVACISSGLITLPPATICYGTSKVALNWAMRKIHFENDWLVAFPLSPRGVSTDMLASTVALDKSGTFQKMVTDKTPTATDAAVSLLKVIDESTREKESGEFMDIDGTKMPFW